MKKVFEVITETSNSEDSKIAETNPLEKCFVFLIILIVDGIN